MPMSDDVDGNMCTMKKKRTKITQSQINVYAYPKVCIKCNKDILGYRLTHVYNKYVVII